MKETKMNELKSLIKRKKINKAQKRREYLLGNTKLMK